MPPTYWSNWGHKIADFEFWAFVNLLLLLEVLSLLEGYRKPCAGSLEACRRALTCTGGNRKPYTESLKLHSDLLPGPAS